MTNLSVEIEVRSPSPESFVFLVKGRLDMATLPKLEERFEAFFPKCANKKVVLDLFEATYVSSICWSVFLIYTRRVKAIGGILLLAGMRDEVLNAYELLELHLFIQKFPNVSEALALSSLQPAAKIKVKA